MEVLLETCCGLDVHAEFVTACVLSGSGTKPQKQIREFKTTTAGLLALREWLVDLQCRPVAMESTGVYWKPVWHVLEGPDLELLLANAQAVKAIKGRKTDASDAQWIAKLHRSGLLVASFVPPEPIRDLRDVTRYRLSLVHEQTAERNRLQKILEDANIKLARVASDVFGVSGWEMLKALAETDGKPDVARVASLARGRLREKNEALQEALDGKIREHHRYMLRLSMTRLDQIAATIANLEARIDQYLQPYRDEIALLETVPGMKRRSAAVVIAEAGADMDVFVDAGHFASWVGVCPGNKCRQKEAGAHPRREPPSPGCALRDGMGSVAHTEHLSQRDFLAPHGPDGQEEGTGRHCAQTGYRGVPHPQGV